MDIHNDSIFKKALNPKRRAIEPTLRARTEKAQGTRWSLRGGHCQPSPPPGPTKPPLGLVPQAAACGAQVGGHDETGVAVTAIFSHSSPVGSRVCWTSHEGEGMDSVAVGRKGTEGGAPALNLC